MSVCSDSPCAAVSGGESACTAGEGGGGFMLFGVRVQVDPMRKCVSMNNMSEYAPAINSAAEGGGAAGYVSADDAVPPPSNACAERKRVAGVPWTEEEHKLFLIGLQKVGKGDWRGISRNYVKTRTPTQVASHAQKYFLRQSNLSRRRRRSSLFDITTDSVNATPKEESKSQEGGTQAQPVPNQNFVMLPVTSNINGGFSIMPSHMTVGLVPVSMENTAGLAQSGDRMSNPSPMFVHQVPYFPIMPTQPGMVGINLNQQVQPLCLRLSLSSGPQPLPTNGSSFKVMPRFGNGDSFVTVA